MRSAKALRTLRPRSTLLSGCWAAEQEDLQQWMAEAAREVRPTCRPSPEPKKFTPQAVHRRRGLRAVQQPEADAGAAPRLGPAQHLGPDRAGAGAAQGSARGLPLDSMAMVGSLSRNGQPVGPDQRRQAALPGAGRQLPGTRTTGASPVSAKPNSACVKSCRTPPVNGSNAWRRCSCKRGRNESTKIDACAVAARAGAALVDVRAPWRRRHAQNAIESVTSSMQSGAEVDPHRPHAAAGRGARRLRDPDAGPHRAGFPGRDQRHRPLGDRGEPGQPALGQRGPGRRAHRAWC